MVCAPVRSIIPSLKLGDYLSVQAHKPCSTSHKANVFTPFQSVVLFAISHVLGDNRISEPYPVKTGPHYSLISLRC